ncbi:transglutaminase-like domain-containing protein [Reyranella sp.]|uniref:transglutaminase-like domain-containing protein n=1 Tax=Reyranella sp. TaxID=1929291 RepID=UPI00271EFBAA|nr:transglutaminase-like domain-containing protein [Reyranella sp.]MDO8973275.1 transglutaminase-like domain-containing protein [Reyranella sp.]
MNHAAFRTPVGLSDAGLWALQFAALPDDVAGLAKVLQGLLIHEHMPDVYGVRLSDRQRGEPHTRSAEEILERIAVQDPQPLSRARSPAERFAGCCRHYALLHVAMLRSKGIAARARCGFGAYFTKDRFIDHWVAEVFDAARRRWILVDAQIDDRQRTLFGIDFDTLDVPRDRFLVAGDAWRLCRAGQADPQCFGVLDMAGLWFIASNVIRDVAALNNREMLPWDVWGGMTLVDSEIDPAFIDRLARLTRKPDEHLDDLRAVYDDPRIAVPPTVFNAVLRRPEAVSPFALSA